MDAKRPQAISHPSPRRLIIPTISNVVVTRRYAALQPLNSRPHLYMIFTLWAGVFSGLLHPVIGEGGRSLYGFFKIPTTYHSPRYE